MVTALLNKHTDDAVRVGPLDKPLVWYSPSQRTWLLAEDYLGVVDGHTWYIRAPWPFDLSSVPRVFWFAVAPNELGVKPPLVHDWLYRHGGEAPTVSGNVVKYTRAQADKLFSDLIREEGVPEWKRRVAYIAVRIGGWRSWRG